MYYSIKYKGAYLQRLEANENYRQKNAPTMGNRYTFSEFKTIWGEKPEPIEKQTVCSYLKCLFEEFRWGDKSADRIEILPIENGDDCI